MCCCPPCWQWPSSCPPPAKAAGPEHSNFSGTQPGVDACGITTTLTFRGVDNFFPIFDASGNLIGYKDTHQERDVFTAANGKSIENHFAQEVTASSFTTNADGSSTAEFTYKGLLWQISTPTARADAGCGGDHLRGCVR